MKKYLTMGISFLLIIASILFAPIEHNDVKFGKGKGKSTAVTTVKDFGDVFNFLSQLNFSDRPEEDSGITTLSYRTISDENEDATKNKHTSVTVHNVSVGSAKTVISGTTTSTSINRDLSIYITQYEAYYKSIGTLSTSTTYKHGDESPESSHLDFDIEIFIDKSGVMLKFNKFDIVGASVDFEFSSEVFGKWFKFPFESDTDDIVDVDLMNKELFRAIGLYINEHKTTDFDSKGNVYSIKKDMLSDALGSIFGVYIPSELGIIGDFTVDLSNAKSPTLLLTLDFSYSDANQSANMYGYENLRFENIDNTVMKGFKDNVEIEIVEDIDDFHDMYVIDKG